MPLPIQVVACCPAIYSWLNSTEKHFSFLFFLIRFFSFYFSACSVWCLLFCDILLLFWMPDKRVVNSNLKRSTSRCSLSATGKRCKQTESESLQHFLPWPNLVYFPTWDLMCLLTSFVVRKGYAILQPYVVCTFFVFEIWDLHNVDEDFSFPRYDAL